LQIHRLFLRETVSQNNGSTLYRKTDADYMLRMKLRNAGRFAPIILAAEAASHKRSR